jgi:hypothetical protein
MLNSVSNRLVGMMDDGVREDQEFPWLQFDNESCLPKTDAPSSVVDQRRNASEPVFRLWNISIRLRLHGGILPSHVDDGSHPSTG